MGAVVGAVLLLLVLSEVSPIYNFRAPEPFQGPDIFNPYQALRDSGAVACLGMLDGSSQWKRAVFHTHTRVKGPWPINECRYWPDYVDSVYRSFGYDIVTFSNHNELISHPYDTTLQVNVY